MTDERRYHDEEIAEIFEAAATPQRSNPRTLSSGDGLTLEQLQEIGREVGVAPERIAEAATALDLRRSALPRRTTLGMPISVGRSVTLPRAPTDREWELLVGELRDTFQAQGKEGSRGSVREWTNGNLHASVEPTENGYRLRMGSLKGDAVPINMMGISAILVGLIVLVGLLASGELGTELNLETDFGASLDVIADLTPPCEPGLPC
jgi:hypothetical protein